MQKKVISDIMLSLLLASMVTLAFNIQPVKAAKNSSYESKMGSILIDDFVTFRTDLWYKRDDVGPGDTTFKPKHVKVSGGLLDLTVPEGKREGGEIVSLREYGYGRYRAKIKASPVAGTVQAFFAYRDPDNPPDPAGHKEIDVELGLWPDRRIITFNTYVDGDENPHNYAIDYDPWIDFHEYGFDWYADHVDFFVDDNLIWTSWDRIPLEPCTIRLNNWVRGGSLPAQESHMYVDWVTYEVWTVDDDGPADFNTIQEAINTASDGDIVYVKAGIYYENVALYKSLKIIGENRETTVIDGSGTGDVVTVYADNVEITSFTIQNGYHGVNFPISVNHNKISYNLILNNYLGLGARVSKDNVFHENILSNNDIGIRLTNCNSTEITSNVVTDSEWIGICLESVLGVVCSFENIVADNVISFSKDTGIIIDYSVANLIYHNNFIENLNQVYVELPPGASNIWDNGYPSGGNYWSDYEETYPYAQEIDDSGIWDTPYVIDENNQDNYPLVNRWTPVPPVEDTEAYMEYTNETIQDLPDEIFSKPGEDVPDVKNDFSDLFDDALENIDEGNYELAIEKLNMIKTKIYEEMAESDERQETISMVDDLIAYLETL